MSWMKLDQLPEELYMAILETIPDVEERKRCTVALSRALPRSPVGIESFCGHTSGELISLLKVPLRWMYNEIRLTSPKGIILLYKHLRQCGGIGSMQAQWVQSLASEVWDADAQILADLFGLLPNVRRLTLSVGTTFAPEHLDDMFQTPRPDLISLRITFCPYVQKATYYQFLKGAYFDSLLIHLSNWPATCKLRYLSIVQTLPPSPTLFQSFAQPIVFFSLEPISRLIHASSIFNTTHIRIQVPARPIAQFLSNPSPSPSPSPTPSHPGTPVLHTALASSRNQPLAKTTFLDLSTTLLSPTHLPSLLSRFPALTHLILDHTGLLPRAAEITGEFANLGQQLATAGIKRAKIRERSIKAFVVAMKLAREAEIGGALAASSEKPGASQQKGEGKTKGGRRGVATAKFSLREKPVSAVALVVGSGTASPSNTSAGTALSMGQVEKIRILPPITPLESLCLTTLVPPTDELVKEWEEDFVKGWIAGVAAVRNARRRVEDGVRMKLVTAWKFADGAVGGSSMAEVEGLVELLDEDWETELEMGRIIGAVPPKLCFAGTDVVDGVLHADGCAHSVSWEEK